jgi:hypothetical protein
MKIKKSWFRYGNLVRDPGAHAPAED